MRGAGMTWASSVVYASVMTDFRDRPGRYKLSWPSELTQEAF